METAFARLIDRACSPGIGILKRRPMTRTSVYALADKSWHTSFRPKGTGDAEWAARIRDHICTALSHSVFQ